MRVTILQDAAEPFNVSVHNAGEHSTVVLFAVGAGGQPARHSTLLDSLVSAGYSVIAPHFARLLSPHPTEQELTQRARRLCLAVDAFSQPEAKVLGVGHSIGATMLVALAGGQMWLGPGRKVAIAGQHRLKRLALLAPATGFFQAPGALDAVSLPMLVWVGASDNITPPQRCSWFADVMSGSTSVDFRITEHAGHFSFMDQVPPNTTEPLTNKQEFLRQYSSEVCNFLSQA